MSRDEFLASLLAERYGPLPVERTNPVRVTEPSRQMLSALAWADRRRDIPPWESPQGWADEMFDRIAA